MGRWGGTNDVIQENGATGAGVNVDGDQPPTLLLDANKLTLRVVREFTPRSKEAMRALGVMPKEVVPRQLKWFEAQLPPAMPNEVAEIRFEHHENRRKQLIKDTRKHRALLVKSRWVPKLEVHTMRKGKHSMSARSMQSMTSPAVSTRSGDMNIMAAAGLQIVDDQVLKQTLKEKERLEQMMDRQNESLEQMILYELQVMKKKSKQKQKVMNRQRYEAEQRRKRKRRQEEISKKKYNMEQRKLRQQEQDEIDARHQAAQDYRDAMTEKRRHDYEAYCARKEMQRKLADKEQARKDFEAKTMGILQEQQNRLSRKMQDMAMSDRMRAMKMRQAKDEQSRRQAEKNLRKKMRIDAALRSNERRMAKRNQDILDHQEHKMRQVRTFKRQQHKKHQAAVRAGADKKAKLKRAQAQAIANRAARVQRLEDKEHRMEQAKRDREKATFVENAVKKEMDRLKHQDKWDSISRGKRVGEYKRAALLTKIEDDDRRLNDMEKLNEYIINQRRMAAVHAQTKKQQILDAFSAFQSSDSCTDFNSAVCGMLKMAECFMEDTTGLKERLADESGVDVRTLEERVREARLPNIPGLKKKRRSKLNTSKSTGALRRRH